MAKSRAEVLTDDRWNVEALYTTKEAWEKDFASFISYQQTPYWPQLAVYQGQLHQGAEKVKGFLDLSMEIERKLSLLYTYAHLRHDEDIADSNFKQAYERILNCLHIFAQETSWFQPELLTLPENTLQSYLQAPDLAPYRFYLEKIIRLKKHTLSPETEKVMALASQAMQTSHQAFSSINDADFKFDSVQDSQGLTHPLSHGSYSLYIRQHDRTLRENAFKTYHAQYLNYENTLSELLSGQIRSHFFNSQSRHYSSCLEAALYPKNIDPAVYHSLIQAVNERLPVLHKYMERRKELLNVDTLHLYDVYVPLVKDVDIKIPYDEAENLVIESSAPLGSDYQNLLRKGLKEQRWVDRYENKNKRSGAYSSGCYGSMPYILMNYKTLLRDVFTLAHEAGHSMHSLYSRQTQPYHYSDYPIFLAEVASTFNEDLLNRLLIQRCSNPLEKIYLINQQIEDIRGTLFRQTMFAEFELFLHEQIEKGIPLTPAFLKEHYSQLNKKYFGPATLIDEEIQIEWARIPHFYYNFYVFQYATGISAALALAEKVTRGGTQEREAYLNFLKGGSSKYPIEMLKLAGVDMQSSLPVKTAIQKFDDLINELHSLTSSLSKK